MKFTTAIVALGMTAMVAAAPQAAESESSSATITAAPTSVSVSVDPKWASTLSCVSACGAGNVYCQAECQGLPVPDESAVNATHDCIAACPPGGDDEKNAAWGECQRACVSSYYWTASTPFYTATLPADATKTGSGPDATATDDSEESGSRTSGGSEATESPNAASINGANLSMLGAFGLFLGALAL